MLFFWTPAQNSCQWMCWHSFNNSSRVVGREGFLCGICQFLWCKYSHHSLISSDPYDVTASRVELGSGSHNWALGCLSQAKHWPSPNFLTSPLLLDTVKYVCWAYVMFPHTPSISTPERVHHCPLPTSVYERPPLQPSSRGCETETPLALALKKLLHIYF